MLSLPWQTEIYRNRGRDRLLQINNKKSKKVFFQQWQEKCFMLKMAKLSDFYIKSHILNDKFQKLISKIVLNDWVSFGLRQDFTKVEVSYTH